MSEDVELTDEEIDQIEADPYLTVEDVVEWRSEGEA